MNYGNRSCPRNQNGRQSCGGGRQYGREYRGSNNRGSVNFYGRNGGAGYDSGHGMNSAYGRPQRQQMPHRKPKRPFPWLELLLTLIAITVVFVLIWAAVGRIQNVGPFAPGNDTVVDTDGVGVTDSGSEPGGTPGENSYTEMTLLTAGDVMYHSPQLEAAYNASTGEYDFLDSYRYIKPIVSAADYAVVNFETTLPGPEWGYSGYPVFSAPDSGFTALLDCGFDMMLFANNHCYDTGMTGVMRTQKVFRENGADWIGARESTSDKTYTTVTVNGIKLGMLNSTDDIAYGNTSPRTINGIKLENGALDYLDVFNQSLLGEFYAQTESRIRELKNDGADIIIYFIHWGSEYYLEHNEVQEQIAQKLCDLGVDIIIGGHPHVIEDADILTSTTDPSHKTLCFYSLGNLVSNQNRLTMGDTMNKEYTENGLMVQLTIRKYSTGECLVSSVETIPLWVHRYYSEQKGAMSYDIVPLEQAISNPGDYGLYGSNFGVSNAEESYRMTNVQLGGICEAFAETVSLPDE